jgi:hypothetical protein
METTMQVVKDILTLGDIQIQLIYVTPTIARAWLDKSGGNRPISQSHVNDLAVPAQNGEWYPANPIMFDWNGHLREGHHRLNVVLSTGLTLPFLVLSGCNPEMFKWIKDHVRPWTAPHEIATIEGSTRCSQTVAAARLIILYDRMVKNGVDYLNYGGLRIRNSELREFCETNRKIFDMSTRIDKANLFPEISSSHQTAAYFLASRLGYERTEEFFAGLWTGINLGNGSPILALRNVMIGYRSTHRKSQAEHRFGLLIKAMRAFEFGQSIQRLSYKPSEAFPRLDFQERDSLKT